MQSDFLKLDASAVLLIGSRQQLSKITIPGVTVGESLIAPCYSDQWSWRPISLYATTPETMTQPEDPLTATRTRRLTMPLLRRAWTWTTPYYLVCLWHTGQTSKVTRITDHIKHVLMNLHWLPDEHRIQYKLLLHTYQLGCSGRQLPTR